MDFTSSPGRSKPITRQHCRLEGDVLRAQASTVLTTFRQFEEALTLPGPWIAGIDLPFGQARRFVADMGWPPNWEGYVRHVETLGKARFESALRKYSDDQPPGQKLHLRRTDKRARSLSPQKLNFTPVGKMFFEGAPRLLRADVTIPHLREGDPGRIVVEAYPGVLARAVTTESYKNDNRKKQTPGQREARGRILEALTSGALSGRYGLTVVANTREFFDDPTGDCLDRPALRGPSRVGVAEPDNPPRRGSRHRSTGGLDRRSRGGVTEYPHFTVRRRPPNQRQALKIP